MKTHVRAPSTPSQSGGSPKSKKSVRDFRAFIIFYLLATVLGATPAAAVTSTITSSFSGQPIANGSWLWFNSHISNLPLFGSNYHIYVVNASVTIVDGGNTHVIPIPDATVSFTDGAPDPVYGIAVAGAWDTTYNGNRVYSEELIGVPNNPFISGVGYQWGQPFDPNNANPVTWTADFLTDSPAVAAQGMRWRFSTAVYSDLTSDISLVDATALDQSAGFNESGTPANYAGSLLAGGMGSGNGNFTGFPSPSGDIFPTLVPEPGTASLAALALWSSAFWRRRRTGR